MKDELEFEEVLILWLNGNCILDEVVSCDFHNFLCH